MPRPDQIKTLTEHVAYEVDMLHGTRQRLRHGVGDTVVRNAVVESFLVHARSLNAFLAPRPANARADDVFAEDFVAGWRRTGNGLAKTDHDRIGKEIAHLTSVRVGVVSKYWPIDLTADDLLGDLADFAAALPDGIDGRDELRSRWRGYAEWAHLFGVLTARSIVPTTGVTCTVHPLASALEEEVGGDHGVPPTIR